MPQSFTASRKLLASLSLVVLLTTAYGHAQQTFIVPSGATPSISSAIAQAVSGDTIEIVPGSMLTESITLNNNNITIKGQSGNPKDCSISAQNNQFVIEIAQGNSSATVIENITIVGNTISHGININNSSPTIRNCIIQNCKFGIEINGASNPLIEKCVIKKNFPGAGLFGCGIFINAGNPTIDDCVIKKNESAFNAGGIQIEGGSPTINNCKIHNNVTTVEGGGILISNPNGRPQITDCTIRGNIAGAGGGIYVTRSSNPLFKDCKISKNIGRNKGGGAWVGNSCHAEFENCTFLKNAVSSNTGKGGGLYIADGDARLTGCDINKNACVKFGGGIYAEDSINAVQVDNCVVKNNVAGGGTGGGFYGQLRTEITLEFSKFNNNTAGDAGGGIALIRSSKSIIRFCSIKRNFAVQNGGGLYVESEDLKFYFTTITHNDAPIGGGVDADFSKVKAYDSRICLNKGGNVKGDVSARSNTVICP